MSNERDRIDRQAEEAAEDYLRRSSITFLECAINLMLTHMSKDQVAAILRGQADIVEDFD